MPCVLIVDDVAENLYFLEALLKGNGFEVCSAGNGSEALASARHNPPDLIVADILMPVMDGYALCREWRADERLKQIPFIFYTATYTEKKDEALALGLGASRFIVKPQDPEILMGIIREVLDQSCKFDMLPEISASNENVLLKTYNETLFRKLEKKMADLELANRELEHQIVEQKRLEEQLRQAQKMEAIGRFSAGIAHDLNNILSVIVGYGTIIQMKMSCADPQRDNLDQILTAADRAANLTRSLLTFSRKQELTLQPLNINSCISNVKTFLERIIGEDITLKMSLAEGEVLVHADKGHIEQVLMNLAANARDAMPTGGVLSIGTDLLEIDEHYIQLHGYGTLGRHALIIFADNGSGMDEETRQRIFEPFFTTKETGKGTGLGLSIIYGIVKQHNGHISVYSEPGQGTTFRILLPLMPEDVAVQDKEACQELLQGGNETILIVDDEASIRDYLKLFLTTLGYSVLLAQDGREAIQVFLEKGQDVDLVLMDVIMPNINGKEAALELRKRKTDIKIIFTSGYPYDLIKERNLQDDNAQLLMKPMTPTDLARKIRVALNGGAGK